MAKLKIKKFSTDSETFKWLAENQQMLKAQRRAKNKETDGMGLHFTSFAVDEKGERIKAEAGGLPVQNTGKIRVKVIINATNILDSHRDLHVKGIWKKSLQEKCFLYLCEQHELTFRGIISDQVKAYTQVFTFKELGVDFEGDCECLVFDCIIEERRNKFMYDQYFDGNVRNHSVRMQYVREYFCMNSEDPEHTQYKENYDKYAPMVANQEALDRYKWFYAVIEAKVVDEGSAVVKGSCFATPTMSVEAVKAIKMKLYADSSPADDFEEKNETPPNSTSQPDEQKKYYYHN